MRENVYFKFLPKYSKILNNVFGSYEFSIKLEGYAVNWAAAATIQQMLDSLAAHNFGFVLRLFC